MRTGTLKAPFQGALWAAIFHRLALAGGHQYGVLGHGGHHDTCSEGHSTWVPDPDSFFFPHVGGGYGKQWELCKHDAYCDHHEACGKIDFDLLDGCLAFEFSGLHGAAITEAEIAVADGRPPSEECPKFGLEYCSAHHGNWACYLPFDKLIPGGSHGSLCPNGESGPVFYIEIKLVVAQGLETFEVHSRGIKEHGSCWWSLSYHCNECSASYDRPHHESPCEGTGCAIDGDSHHGEGHYHEHGPPALEKKSDRTENFGYDTSHREPGQKGELQQLYEHEESPCDEKKEQGCGAHKQGHGDHLGSEHNESPCHEKEQGCSHHRQSHGNLPHEHGEWGHGGQSHHGGHEIGHESGEWGYEAKPHPGFEHGHHDHDGWDHDDSSHHGHEQEHGSWGHDDHSHHGYEHGHGDWGHDSPSHHDYDQEKHGSWAHESPSHHGYEQEHGDWGNESPSHRGHGHGHDGCLEKEGCGDHDDDYSHHEKPEITCEGDSISVFGRSDHSRPLSEFAQQGGSQCGGPGDSYNRYPQTLLQSTVQGELADADRPFGSFVLELVKADDEAKVLASISIHDEAYFVTQTAVFVKCEGGLDDVDVSHPDICQPESYPWSHQDEHGIQSYHFSVEDEFQCSGDYIISVWVKVCVHGGEEWRRV